VALRVIGERRGGLPRNLARWAGANLTFHTSLGAELLWRRRTCTLVAMEASPPGTGQTTSVAGNGRPLLSMRRVGQPPIPQVLLHFSLFSFPKPVPRPLQETLAAANFLSSDPGRFRPSPPPPASSASSSFPTLYRSPMRRSTGGLHRRRASSSSPSCPPHQRLTAADLLHFLAKAAREGGQWRPTTEVSRRRLQPPSASSFHREESQKWRPKESHTRIWFPSSILLL
jgi:hypothetical protein